MNPVLYAISLRIASYFMLIVIIFVTFNLLTQGFALTYARVFASFGKKTLVIVHGITRRYFRAGEISDNRLKYKGADGNKRSTTVDKDVVFRLMSVNAVETDEATGALRKNDFSTVSGFDPVKVDAMIERALALRSLVVDKMGIATLIFVMATVFLCVFILVKVFALQSLLTDIPVKGVV